LLNVRRRRRRRKKTHLPPGSVYRSEMTLNYRVIVERYPFPNGVVDNLIPVLKSSLYLTGKKTS
jgi:hypothetical protein